jgi:2-(1,2-epoxy-1,2-dihydrophenyl)acetyl-CoA isomerase
VSAAGDLPSHHPDVRVARDGHLATVTLDRPASKNACTGDMWVALGAAFQELSYSGVRVITLTGANDNFCSGADLAGGDEDSPRRRTGTMVDSMRVLADVVLSIHRCPVPVVAKVDGLCVGAGLGLALAADLLWCSDRARFSAIFAKRGLSLDFGTSWLLSQRIGVHKAKELAFTAKMVSATEALDIGFVNAVVPAGELDRTVDELVETIAAGPPVALASTKRELDNASSMSLAQALELEGLAQSYNTFTDDMREALTAFMERRPPTFKGR